MKDKLIKLGLTDELAQKVVDNFGDVIDGIYVTKERFNEVNNELKSAKDTIKERDTQLEKLQNDNDSNEDLKKQIADLKKANADAAKEAENKLNAERKSNAVKLELSGKVHNVSVAMSLLKMDDIVMTEDGKVKSGLNEQLKDLQKSDSYLFITDNGNNGNNPNNTTVVKGASPKNGDQGTPSTDTADVAFAKSLASKQNESIKASAENVYFGN
jgi:hypothetical protein